MSDIIFNLLIGLGIGALYAMLGAGLVVSYKGSGVINFAHGAMAMYGMFTFDTAWNRGELFLPWVDVLPTHSLNLPVRITLSEDGTWPFVPSLLLALVMAAFLGFAAHYLVFRPLRNAAPLGKVVASVGLALYLQGVALLNFGNAFPQPRSVVPSEPIENFLGLGRAYPRNTLYVIAFSILLGTVLWALYRYTRFGLATRAAAGNEKGAILLGYSPQQLAALNWILASVTATLGVIIVGPIQGTITPVGLTALIVPALAAALIGGLRSVPVAVAGGLALGAVQTLLDLEKTEWFTGPLMWLQDGVRNVVPLIVIIAVLVLRGRSLPIRGTVEEKRLPLAPQPKRVAEHAIVWMTVVTLFAFVFNDAGPLTIFASSIQTGLTTAIIMLSVVLLTGYVGQISLAQLSFAGIAAFFMARMMADGVGRGSNLVPVTGPDLPWPIAAILGVAAAVIVGLILGLPALRIRGVQLAVVTISFALSIQSLYLENDSLTQLRAGVPAYVQEPTFFGLVIGARSDRQLNERPAFAIFAALILALCAIAVANIRRTGVGRRFLAVRANERAAAAAGINVARTKLLAFALSAAIAGIGGVMLGFRQVEVSSANFIYGASLSVLAFAYLGGITSINGALVGGLIFGGSVVPVVSNYFLADTNIDSYISVLGGLGMIVTAIVHPEGVAPFFQQLMRMLGNWIVRVVPGWATIRAARQDDRRLPVTAALAVLVVAFAFWVYNAKFIESNTIWITFSIVLFWAISLGLAASLGDVAPTFGQAGQAWVDWARRFGPTAAVGYVLGWLVWPLRVDTYSKLWMPILGAAIALFIRATYRGIRYGNHPPPESATDPGPGTDDGEPAGESVTVDADSLRAEVV
jgi:branched-chain amino acid transport system permease protein